MRRFNKLEEAILKMVHKRNKIDNTIGVTWDEYGNPIPLTGEIDNTPDEWCHYSGMPSPNAYVKDIIESKVIENDDTTGI